MRRLTVQILSETLLNEDIRGQEDVVIDAVDAFIVRTNFRRPGQLLPDWIPTPTERRFRRAVQRLDTFVDDLIAERQAEEMDVGEDVRAMLLDASEDGELLQAEVRHNLVAFLMAGHESPSGALTRVWYLLDDHPDVYESLCEEYDRVVTGDRPTIDDVVGASDPLGFFGSYDLSEYMIQGHDSEFDELMPAMDLVAREQLKEARCVFDRVHNITDTYSREIEPVVKSGEAVEEIVSYAEEQTVDRIIIAEYPPTELRLLLRSVPESVVQNTSIPVTIRR